MLLVMQAAVSAAASAVLRNYAATPQDLESTAAIIPGRDPQQVITDCVYALCQWRDDVARREDEGHVASALVGKVCVSCMDAMLEVCQQWHVWFTH